MISIKKKDEFIGCCDNSIKVESSQLDAQLEDRIYHTIEDNTCFGEIILTVAELKRILEIAEKHEREIRNTIKHRRESL